MFPSACPAKRASVSMSSSARRSVKAWRCGRGCGNRRHCLGEARDRESIDLMLNPAETGAPGIGQHQYPRSRKNSRADSQRLYWGRTRVRTRPKLFHAGVVDLDATFAMRGSPQSCGKIWKNSANSFPTMTRSLTRFWRAKLLRLGRTLSGTRYDGNWSCMRTQLLPRV